MGEKKEQREEILKDPVSVFARRLGAPQRSAGYVTIMTSKKAYSDAEGVMLSGSKERIEQALL